MESVGDQRAVDNLCDLVIIVYMVISIMYDIFTTFILYCNVITYLLCIITWFPIVQINMQQFTRLV